MAFECLHSILENDAQLLDKKDLMQALTNGLKDTSMEIRMLVHLILQRFVSLFPNVIVEWLDSLVDPLNADVSLKPKQNAVKQEIEKMNEMISSAIKTLVVITKHVNVPQGSTFDVLYSTVAKNPTSPVAELVEAVSKSI
jgi:cullin-associated NEDD8-dissociated protein 1